MAWKVSRFMVFAREQTIKDQSFFSSSSSFLGRLRRPFVEVQTPLALGTTSGRPTEHDIVV